MTTDLQDGREVVPNETCRRLLFAFGLECNAIGLLGAAENLYRGMKEAAAVIKAPAIHGALDPAQLLTPGRVLTHSELGPMQYLGLDEGYFRFEVVGGRQWKQYNREELVCWFKEFSAKEASTDQVKAPPLIQTLHENGERIALEATVKQQAEYIRLLEIDAGRYRILRQTPSFAMTLGKPSTPEQIDQLCDLALRP